MLMRTTRRTFTFKLHLCYYLHERDSEVAAEILHLQNGLCTMFNISLALSAAVDVTSDKFAEVMSSFSTLKLSSS